MVAASWNTTTFLGRVLTGRIEQGRARLNMPVQGAAPATASVVETGRLTKLLSFRGLERVPVEEAEAGDIVAVAGPGRSNGRRTRSARRAETALPATPVDPPTLAMTFRINDGPLAGREGKKVTSRQIRERLLPRGRGQCRDPRHANPRRRRPSRSPAAANCSSAC